MPSCEISALKGDWNQGSANKAVELAKKKTLSKAGTRVLKDAEEIIAAVENKLTGIRMSRRALAIAS